MPLRGPRLDHFGGPQTQRLPRPPVILAGRLGIADNPADIDLGRRNLRFGHTTTACMQRCHRASPKRQHVAQPLAHTSDGPQVVHHLVSAVAHAPVQRERLATDGDRVGPGRFIDRPQVRTVTAGHDPQRLQRVRTIEVGTIADDRLLGRLGDIDSERIDQELGTHQPGRHHRGQMVHVFADRRHRPIGPGEPYTIRQPLHGQGRQPLGLFDGADGILARPTHRVEPTVVTRFPGGDQPCAGLGGADRWCHGARVSRVHARTGRAERQTRR